ncbi:Tcoingi protein [Trypanosoma conorhini]|uniref:Tcoingi protein n=1 Tax=Trypanosoma conorhini TaxID=83891 RepID=A0A422MT49_9TRYP|nr:Tcoingi protein [Trypanosoma conorhini]RNE96384.1 Tcoingi protein [Trypanosoma conorhini]
MERCSRPVPGEAASCGLARAVCAPRPASVPVAAADGRPTATKERADTLARVCAATSDFPFGELDAALREVRLRSAPGLGALHCEALHQPPLAACKELAAAFNRSIGDGGTPDSREVGIVTIPPLKPGKPGK